MTMQGFISANAANAVSYIIAYLKRVIVNAEELVVKLQGG